MKLGLSLNNTNRVPSSSYDSSTQEVLTYAEGLGYTLPVDALTPLDTFIIGAKDAGIWDLLDFIHLEATDGDANFAKLNLKSPGNFNLALIGTPVFTSKKGFSCNTGISALNTQWTPSVDGVNYTQNNASIGVWLYESPVARNQNHSVYGCTDGTRRIELIAMTGYNNQDTVQRINSTIASTLNILSPPGLHTINRSSSVDFNYYRGASLAVGGFGASNGLSTQPLYFGNYNNNSSLSVTTRYSGNISISFASADLTSKMADLNTLCTNYMTSI